MVVQLAQTSLFHLRCFLVALLLSREKRKTVEVLLNKDNNRPRYERGHWLLSTRLNHSVPTLFLFGGVSTFQDVD